MPLLNPRNSRKPWLTASFRILLALFFIVSGLLKIVDLPRFFQDVLNFDVVDGPPAEWIAIVVPTAEIILGALLAFNLMTPAVLTMLGGMMITFTVAIGMAWSKGLNITCGCFGKLSEGPMDYPIRVTINSGIILVIAVLLIISLKRPRYHHKPAYTLPKRLFEEK